MYKTMKSFISVTQHIHMFSLSSIITRSRIYRYTNSTIVCIYSHFAKLSLNDFIYLSSDSFWVFCFLLHKQKTSFLSPNWDFVRRLYTLSIHWQNEIVIYKNFSKSRSSIIRPIEINDARWQHCRKWLTWQHQQNLMGTIASVDRTAALHNTKRRRVKHMFEWNMF